MRLQTILVCLLISLAAGSARGQTADLSGGWINRDDERLDAQHNTNTGEIIFRSAGGNIVIRGRISGDVIDAELFTVPGAELPDFFIEELGCTVDQAVPQPFTGAIQDDGQTIAARIQGGSLEEGCSFQTIDQWSEYTLTRVDAGPQPPRPFSTLACPEPDNLGTLLAELEAKSREAATRHKGLPSWHSYTNRDYAELRGLDIAAMRHATSEAIDNQGPDNFLAGMLQRRGAVRTFIDEAATFRAAEEFCDIAAWRSLAARLKVQLDDVAMARGMAERRRNNAEELYLRYGGQIVDALDGTWTDDSFFVQFMQAIGFSNMNAVRSSLLGTILGVPGAALNEMSNKPSGGIFAWLSILTSYSKILSATVDLTRLNDAENKLPIFLEMAEHNAYAEHIFDHYDDVETQMRIIQDLARWHFPPIVYRRQ